MSVRERNTVSVTMPLENGRNFMRISLKIKFFSHKFSHNKWIKEKGLTSVVANPLK
jgi:hypothetical protein